jgi:cyanocobalamin reductase (cyanide-eliminating) / alkylcobalamin dealkylase
VLVLGNTRALWPFVDCFVRESDGAVPDPVDEYVSRVVHGAVTAAGVTPVDVRFDFEPPERRIAIQRLADVAGLAWLSPSHLCVHPVHGPWIALRAAVVLDAESLAVESLDAELTPTAWSQAAMVPCDCAAHCRPVLERALAAGEPTNQAELRERWRLWLAVRDACPAGRQARYTDEQIVYHYTGRRPAHWPPIER